HVRVSDGEYALYYDARLFSAERAQRLARAFVQVLRAPSAMPVGRVPLLGPSEAEEQLADFSTPSFHWPKHLVLHELFEAIVDRSPGAVAIVCGDQRVTYGELDARANALARRLIE